MKVTGVKTYLYHGHFNWLLVKLETDEGIEGWGFRDLFEKRAAAIINPDISHEGGILETKKIADMAHAYYVSVAPHSASGPVLTAASIQMEAATPNFLIHEFFSIDIPYYEEVLKDPFPVITDNNYIELPTKPGLGIEIDESALNKRPYKFVDIGNLWKGHDEWRKSAGRQ